VAEGQENIRTFAELGLSEARLAAVEALGWVTPTPIQVQGIPSALEGGDVVGIAQTGTGKTGGFMLPSLERVEAGGGLQVLVLCPTRELAQQVSDDTEAFCKGTSLRVGTIYGGVKYGPQLTALSEGYEIISATPGRFNDHMSRGNVDLSAVKVLILDEADRMLDMGFRPQIEDVLRKAPRGRQTMLFSATMPHGVHDLATRITREATWIEVAPSGTKAEGITEVVYSVKPEKKSELLGTPIAGWPSGRRRSSDSCRGISESWSPRTSRSEGWTWRGSRTSSTTTFRSIRRTTSTGSVGRVGQARRERP
jgi:ATP-dependent RNA helicase RhlE